MADPKADHGRARYVLARIELMDGHPDEAMAGFTRNACAKRKTRAPWRGATFISAACTTPCASPTATRPSPNTRQR